MTCVLLNHNFINEVQTITQLFFPGDGFRFVSEPLAEYPPGYVVQAEISESAAMAQVYKDSILTSEYSLPLDSLPLHLSPGRVLMLALYHALQAAIGAYAPWGALTGIRPSKMVREWLDAGWSDEKIVATLADPFCCTHEKARLALTVAHAERDLTGRIFKQPSEAGLCNTKSGLQPPYNPIGIYISIPFCPSRCVYCSFNVNHNFASKDIHAQYIAAVVQECKTQADRLRQMGGTISSIYIGGGTPTVLSESLLEQLLDSVAEVFLPTEEFSVEAGRPDTLTKDKLDILRRYGVNRIAVNPQTLKDKTLSLIGRKHTAADFFKAFNIARDMGFTCINTDIIAGLPGETPDDMRRTMEGIAELSPENITVHTLAVKRASRLNEILSDSVASLGKCSRGLPDGTVWFGAEPHLIEEMLAIAGNACADAGLNPYYMYRQKNMVGMFENVGYSKPGYECLYNVGMMAETQTVLGIGAGAVSKFVEEGKISREFNVKNPEIYVERQQVSNIHKNETER